MCSDASKFLENYCNVVFYFFSLCSLFIQVRQHEFREEFRKTAPLHFDSQNVYSVIDNVSIVGNLFLGGRNDIFPFPPIYLLKVWIYNLGQKLWRESVIIAQMTSPLLPPSMFKVKVKSNTCNSIWNRGKGGWWINDDKNVPFFRFRHYFFFVHDCRGEVRAAISPRWSVKSLLRIPF